MPREQIPMLGSIQWLCRFIFEISSITREFVLLTGGEATNYVELVRRCYQWAFTPIGKIGAAVGAFRFLVVAGGRDQAAAQLDATESRDRILRSFAGLVDSRQIYEAFSSVFGGPTDWLLSDAWDVSDRASSEQ